jgi:hypothetical protein
MGCPGDQKGEMTNGNLRQQGPVDKASREKNTRMLLDDQVGENNSRVLAHIMKLNATSKDISCSMIWM